MKKLFVVSILVLLNSINLINAMDNEKNSAKSFLRGKDHLMIYSISKSPSKEEIEAFKKDLYDIDLTAIQKIMHLSKKHPALFDDATKIVVTLQIKKKTSEPGKYNKSI